MSLDPEDPKVRWAVFGRQVEHFLETDVGVYLVKRARDDSAQAFEDFKSVDPFDGKAVAAIQRKAQLAETVIDYLAEAIRAGETATEQLKAESIE